MARITLEAATKDVKNSKTGELVYVAGQTRVKNLAIIYTHFL